MILTCPNCNSQFSLDADLLGEDGAKVRCSSCEEVWFQEAEYLENIDVPDVDEGNDDDFFEVDISIDTDEEEETNEEEDNASEDNVDSDDVAVVEDQEQGDDTSSFDSVSPPRRQADGKKSGVYKGYSIAACVFIVILLYLLIQSSSIMKSNPSMLAFYKVFGIQMTIPGEGLVFDRVEAVEENGTVRVSGSLINLDEEDKEIPVIEASLADAHGEVLATWYVALSESVLVAEGVLDFDSLYYLSVEDAHAPSSGSSSHHPSEEDTRHVVAHDEAAHDEAAHDVGGSEKQVRLRFVLLARTDVEADGSNQAHHESESDHQSDHAGSSGSHQPASSQSHQEHGHQSHGASH